MHTSVRVARVAPSAAIGEVERLAKHRNRVQLIYHTRSFAECCFVGETLITIVSDRSYTPAEDGV